MAAQDLHQDRCADARTHISRSPIRTAAELAQLDDAEMLDGYIDGYRNDPEPGGNRSTAYWHGWRNGMVDGGHATKDDAQAALAHEMHQRAVAARAARNASPHSLSVSQEEPKSPSLPDGRAG